MKDSKANYLNILSQQRQDCDNRYDPLSTHEHLLRESPEKFSIPQQQCTTPQGGSIHGRTREKYPLPLLTSQTASEPPITQQVIVEVYEKVWRKYHRGIRCEDLYDGEFAVTRNAKHAKNAIKYHVGRKNLLVIPPTKRPREYVTRGVYEERRGDINTREGVNNFNNKFSMPQRLWEYRPPNPHLNPQELSNEEEEEEKG